jgi:hypothetical protein
VIGFYALPLAAFDGDLTRMAPLPEKQFGWLKPQPLLNPALIKQVSLAEADVLVIGDSFSDQRVWQSVLIEKGLKVRTELWGSIPFICADLDQTLQQAGFKGKFLIIESVERNLPHRLKDSMQCIHSNYQYQSLLDSKRNPPPILVDRHQKNYDSKLLVGINTLLNSIIFASQPEALHNAPYALNPEVAVRAVTNGCQLFSHPACSHALFYAEENANDYWQEHIQSIRVLNTRLTSFKPIWVIIPNKTTVYFYPQKNLWKELAKNGLGPDLLGMTTGALTNYSVDLFPGNNTHFSTEGYLQLGGAVLAELTL